MQNWLSYAEKNGIPLQQEGACQFCGAPVTGGVMECHSNTNHIAALLDFNDAANYTTRFLSVDAMALQHCELHGPWNNHIHLTRLFLIFEKKIKWQYALTPLLSNIINEYKRDRKETLAAPPPKQRGAITTAGLLQAQTAEQCRQIVHDWAYSVYTAFDMHHTVAGNIASKFMERYR